MWTCLGVSGQPSVMALWNVISEITNDVIVINTCSCNTSLTRLQREWRL